MQGCGASKFLLVFILTFVGAATCMIGISVIMNPFRRLSPTLTDFIVFISTVIAWGSVARLLASEVLFGRVNPNDFQVFCSALNTGAGHDVLGSGVMWPFAKLTVSKTILRFQSPWSDYLWKIGSDAPVIQCPSHFLDTFAILEAGSRNQAIEFSVAPWRIKRVRNALQAFGWNLKPLT